VAERWRRPMGRAVGANAEAEPMRAAAARIALLYIAESVRDALDPLMSLICQVYIWYISRSLMMIKKKAKGNSKISRERGKVPVCQVVWGPRRRRA